MLERLQRAMIFPRGSAVPDPNPGAGVRGLERSWIEADGARVESWFLPGGSGSVVMFAHGNAELIDYWPQMLEPYRELGVGIWLGEYRGYGRSSGEPSEVAITEDFVQMYDRLTARADVDTARVFFHGRSLGGGVMAQLAARRTPAALILESTFTSIADLARQFMLPRGLVSDPFDTLGVLRELDVPVLLFHGQFDSVIPHVHAERLRDAARDAHLVTYPADHNDFPPDRAAYWDEIGKFLGSCGIVAN